MEHISYTPLYPTSRETALALVQALFPTIVAFGLTLLNAGTGIGKTRIMRHMSEYMDTAVTYLIAPSAMIGRQLLEEFAQTHIIVDIKEKAYNSSAKLEKAVLNALYDRTKILIVCSHLGHRNRAFTNETEIIRTMMERLAKRNVVQLALIDEFHASLTSLSGGMNARISTTKPDMEVYAKLRDQQLMSLNLFDVFRDCGVRVVGCSATLNNVICSKMTTTGYAPKDVQIWNLFPIESLYNKLVCNAMDTRNFSLIAPYLERAEKEDGKILLIFTCQDGIDIFIKDYETYFGRSMPPLARITAKEELGDIDASLVSAKYVAGINLIGTGFDLASHVRFARFAIGILFRKYSDKKSQPLGENPTHPLHVGLSGNLAQALGRLREGGLFLVPDEFEGISLLGLHQSVTNAIHNGYTEYGKLYIPADRQLERYHHAIMIALHQNLYPDEEEDREVVQRILDDLTTLTGRNFKEESRALRKWFWARAIGTLWEIYHEEKDKTVRARLYIRDRDKIRTGKGYSEGREQELRIREEVIERARGICCHCSRSDGPSDNWQVCHFKACARGGPYTLDNLGYGHKGCDDMAFDGNGDLIHDPHGGFWRNGRITFYPDPWQRSFISPAYIDDRWIQQKERFGVTGDFRTWLSENGWRLIRETR